MGKYSFTSGDLHIEERHRVQQGRLLMSIANELAEANRLKRFEIERKFSLSEESRKALVDTD